MSKAELLQRRRMRQVRQRANFLMNFGQQLLHLLDQAEASGFGRFVLQSAENEPHRYKQLRGGIVKLAAHAPALDSLTFDQRAGRLILLAAKLEYLREV